MAYLETRTEALAVQVRWGDGGGGLEGAGGGWREE